MFPKTLRGKFTFVYVGLALLALLVGLAGVWNLFRIEQSVDNLMTANYKSIDAVSHMMESIERQDSGMLICLSVSMDKGLEIFTDNGDEFLRWFTIERGNVTELGELDVIDRLERNYSQYQLMIFMLRDKMDEGMATAQSYYSNEVLPRLESIKNDCRQLVLINEQAMFRSKKNTADSAKQSMMALLIISLAAVMGGYFIARYFILLFLNPIKKLSDSIIRVREGDLNQQVQVRANDEAGKLAAEFNSMTRRLLDYEQSSVGMLMAEKQKSLAIVRSISDPLLVLDAGWRILLVNDACGRFFNLDGEAVEGRHFLEAIPDGGLFQEIERLAAAQNTAESKIIRIQKEEEYYFNLAVTRVDDPDSRLSGIIVALQNVTGLKEIERVKTDFLAAISHEFKTPLTSIMMAASILQENGMGPLNPEQAETVDTIRADGERLLGLVNDLLELMKIESGRQVYEIGPCDLNAITAAAFGEFSDTAHRQGVRLYNALEDGLPPAMADASKIGWVMNNLIGNALKYTGSGDTVTLSARFDSLFVTVSVKDTGVGIPEEDQERIFDKFVQVKHGGIEVSGTGLGLSVSREIIRSMGGDISVKSRVGEGSEFTFTLPRADCGEIK